MNIFVDFLDESQAVVKSIMCNPQDPEAYPNQGIVDEADERYIAFMSSLQPSAVEIAQEERDRLLAIATLRMAPLQDAVDLDDATAGEVALLKKWKQYRVSLNRIDITPINIVWPVQPE